MQTAAKRDSARLNVQTAGLVVVVQVWKGEPRAGGGVDYLAVKISVSC